MTDLNLNPQLGTRLREIQKYWGHESKSETLALILDSCMHRWGVPPPPVNTLNASQGCRVRLKQRHVDYFSPMSQMAGCTVSSLARSVLIQWICMAQPTLAFPEQTQMQQGRTSLLPEPTRKKKKPASKKDKPAPSTSFDDNSTQPLPATVKVNSKFNARESLLALKKP